jgi:hypothetical protein
LLRAIELLDWYHLAEALRRAIGDERPDRLDLALAVAEPGDAEGLAELLAGWAFEEAGADLARSDKLTAVWGYVTANRRAIEHYAIVPLASSGPMEKAVDIVVARRFKARGMSWLRRGVSALVRLRLLRLNGTWTRYWAERFVGEARWRRREGERDDPVAILARVGPLAAGPRRVMQPCEAPDLEAPPPEQDGHRAHSDVPRDPVVRHPGGGGGQHDPRSRREALLGPAGARERPQRGELGVVNVQRRRWTIRHAQHRSCDLAKHLAFFVARHCGGTPVLTGAIERHGVRSMNEEARDPHRVVGG